MELKKIDVGLTNDIYGNRDFFIKKSKDYVDKYINRNNEKNFWEIKDLPIEFIRPIEFNILKNTEIKFKNIGSHKNLYTKKITKKIINKICILIQKIRSIEVNEKIDVFNPKEYFLFFKKNIKNLKIDIKEEYISEILESLPNFDKSNLVLSHNDLVPGNFIFKKRKTYLIDFEYISINHFLFDIASFISESIYYSPDLINYFIFKCIEKKLMEKDDINDLEKIINYQNLLWIYWANYMYENDKKEIYLEIIKSKKNFLLKKDTN